MNSIVALLERYALLLLMRKVEKLKGCGWIGRGSKFKYNAVDNWQDHPVVSK